MNEENTTSLQRLTNEGWSLNAHGDNGFDLLLYVIKVNDLTAAVQVSKDVADLVMEHIFSESAFTRITLRSWQVEIMMSAPVGTWWSKEQRQFALAIARAWPLARPY